MQNASIIEYSMSYTGDSTFFFLWKLFEAAAYSLGIKLPVPEGAEACFQKLLRSTDPAVLAADPDAVNPVISENELEIIRHDLQSGIKLISKYTSLSDRR